MGAFVIAGFLPWWRFGGIGISPWLLFDYERSEIAPYSVLGQRGDPVSAFLFGTLGLMAVAAVIALCLRTAGRVLLPRAFSPTTVCVLATTAVTLAAASWVGLNGLVFVSVGMASFAALGGWGSAWIGLATQLVGCALAAYGLQLDFDAYAQCQP